MQRSDSADPATTAHFRCGICGSEAEPTRYRVREMMFGTRDAFGYLECAACGCLQIEAIPQDMSKHYPADYYAHAAEPARPSRIKEPIRRLRNRYAFSGRGRLGKLLHTLFPYPHRTPSQWLSHAPLTRDSRILDVGCGAGELLHDLSDEGYRDLLGIDPYIKRDLDPRPGLRIRKMTIHEVEGSFDLIMFHHSLEHVADQLETLKAVERLLSPSGVCLVRIPTASSFAWEHYRENWVQLDAPRHFYLHTVESIRLLGERAGLRLVDVEFDSTEFQFTGSEMYAREVPLREGTGGFSRRQLREFRRRAEALNREGRGDSAAFYFRRL